MGVIPRRAHPNENCGAENIPYLNCISVIIFIVILGYSLSWCYHWHSEGTLTLPILFLKIAIYDSFKIESLIFFKKGEGLSGTCIKDTWTKPKRGKIKGGRWAWLGWREVVGGKWRQLYLNSNIKKLNWW